MTNLKGMRWNMFGHNVVWVEAAEDIPANSRVDYDSDWSATVGGMTETRAPRAEKPKGSRFWVDFVK